MNTKMATLLCSTFLTAALGTGNADAFGPENFMYGGTPYMYGGTPYMPIPNHQLIAPEILGPFGILGQRGPLSPGAPLERLGTMIFPQLLGQRQIPQIYGAPPSATQSVSPAEQRVTTTTIIQHPAPHPSQKGGYGADGNYHFPLLPEHLKP